MCGVLRVVEYEPTNVHRRMRDLRAWESECWSKKVNIRMGRADPYARYGLRWSVLCSQFGRVVLTMPDSQSEIERRWHDVNYQSGCVRI